MTASLRVRGKEDEKEGGTHWQSSCMEDRRTPGCQVRVQTPSSRVKDFHVEVLFQSSVVAGVALDEQAVPRLVRDDAVAQGLRRTCRHDVEETGFPLDADAVRGYASQLSIAELGSRGVDCLAA